MEQFKGKYVRPWGDENIFGDRGLPAVEITAKEGDKWHIKMECPVMDIRVKLDEEIEKPTYNGPHGYLVSFESRGRRRRRGEVSTGKVVIVQQPKDKSIDFSTKVTLELVKDHEYNHNPTRAPWIMLVKTMIFGGNEEIKHVQKLKKV